MASSNSNPASSAPTPVPFPQPEGLRDPNAQSPTTESPTTETRQRTSTTTSTASSRIRTASIKLMGATPPPGMWAATGATASKAPSLSDIRKGSFGTEGWCEETQRKRAGSRTSQGEERSPTERTPGTKKMASSNNALATEPFPALTEERTQDVPRHDGQDKETVPGVESEHSSETAEKMMRTSSGQYANGYVPPPKLPWKRSFAIGLKGFWKWFRTPAGFLITIYGLNVVAWGGMLFLLLCNASPAMCVPSCNDINSPRRKWIEIDSQILNALFCVTGFGLAPWRFRDLYWWGWWRLGGPKRRDIGIRRLAGLHRGWFRLPGSDRLPEEADATYVDPEDPAVPIPVSSIPDPPPTGIRAPPTKSWKMDFVLWNNAWNTFFQVVLCYYMYNYNRYKRPSWATGTFVALGCIVAGIAGIMMWHEGKNIKKIEGVPMRKDYEDRRGDAEAHSPQEVPLVPTGKAARS
ncbi:uncharacterized protein K460DRAFT_283662 [Cucurbitaria berberidis CBS 394.84]|uniref:Uncharacterized protein n=1 Tax=Cucurbitaria berberidis CBS 394.84 TaxID=1168544 RepID=A0A9P4L7Y0_9PLEO|nr:uncharacterized protein K460DRAFT_283662 [Cucurbitaria berberidis CBS 394.84]KAF1844759.1 hypothetical protein K460DRAFT_283662 [Cucurbitaria berberidis CBS 394.84]